MLRTILTSSYISVQGEYVRTLADGRVEVRTGEKTYVGRVISAIRDRMEDASIKLADA